MVYGTVVEEKQKRRFDGEIRDLESKPPSSPSCNSYGIEKKGCMLVVFACVFILQLPTLVRYYVRPLLRYHVIFLLSFLIHIAHVCLTHSHENDAVVFSRAPRCLLFLAQWMWLTCGTSRHSRRTVATAHAGGYRGKSASLLRHGRAEV